MTSTRPQPRLFITLVAGRLQAEVAGLNGARRRLDLPDGQVEATIRAELLDQEARIDEAERASRDRDRRAEALRAERVFARTAINHDLALAERIFGRKSPERTKPALQARLRQVNATLADLGL